jgi:hypothetical protein
MGKKNKKKKIVLFFSNNVPFIFLYFPAERKTADGSQQSWEAARVAKWEAVGGRGREVERVSE